MEILRAEQVGGEIVDVVLFSVSFDFGVLESAKFGIGKVRDFPPGAQGIVSDGAVQGWSLVMRMEE